MEERWSSHFLEVNSLLLAAERQYGIASASYSDHFIERFEVAIRSCSSILHGLENPPVSLNDAEQSILGDIKGSIRHLIVELRSLLRRWGEYRDLLDSHYQNDVSYQTPVVRNGRRGRPRFRIDKEQLEYLLSLSFNWSEIAALLGVSRMTVFRYV